jgi:hypothetical protein
MAGTPEILPQWVLDIAGLLIDQHPQKRHAAVDDGWENH